MVTTKQALDILGLAQPATQQEIKQAWQRMAAAHHPDKGGDAVKFNDCKIAYNHLRSLKIQQKCQFCGGARCVRYKKAGLNFKMKCVNC
jgi:hypothetical protein